MRLQLIVEWWVDGYEDEAKELERLFELLDIHLDTVDSGFKVLGYTKLEEV